MSSSTKVLKTGLEQILEALNNGTIEVGGEKGLTLDSLIKHVGEDQRKAIQEDRAEEEAAQKLKDGRCTLIELTHDKLNMKVINLGKELRKEAEGIEGLMRNREDPAKDDVERLMARLTGQVGSILKGLTDTVNKDGDVVSTRDVKVYGKVSRRGKSGNGTRAGAISLYLNGSLIDYASFYNEVLGQEIGADKGFRGVLNALNSKEIDLFGTHNGDSKYEGSLVVGEISGAELGEIGTLIASEFGKDFYMKRAGM
jgi:hypothetical protein